MPSTRRVSAPTSRISKSNTPTQQSTLVTPKKSIRKNNTYGKSSSAKKTTLAQVWGWEKILNEQLEEEERDQSQGNKDDDTEVLIRPNLKHASDNSSSNRLHTKKRKKFRRKTASDAIQEDEDAQILTTEPKNVKRTRRKTAGDEPSTGIKPLDQFSNQTVKTNISVSIKEKGEEEIKEISQNVGLAQKNISFSQEPQPLVDVEKLSEISNRSESLFLMSNKIEEEKASGPQTPKGDSGIEVPSSQSLATPMSLPNRSSARFHEPLKNTLLKSPIPFKLPKNSSLSTEVKDTFDPGYNFLRTKHEKDSNLEIQDTFDLGSDFTFIDRIHSTPVKLSSPLKSVKFAPPCEQTGYVQVPSSPFTSKKAKPNSIPRLTSFEFKTEISDSEAESEIEFEDFKEIVQIRNKSCDKDIDVINKESLIASHQVLENRCEQKLNHQCPDLMEPETYFGETFGQETQYELSGLGTCPLSEIILNGKEECLTGFPKKSVEIESFPGADQENREFLREKTQYVESQRLSTQYLAQMAPRTGESDVFISIDAQRVTEILSGIRDHETRRYRLPPPVCRAWLFERSPKYAVKYMAEISPAKRPGDIINETGVGNKAFNLKKSNTSWVAYEILQLYELADPLSLDELKSREWLKTAPKPMKWTKIPPAVVDELVANIRSSVFDKEICFNSTTSPSRNNKPAGLEESDSTDKHIQTDSYDEYISERLCNDDEMNFDNILSHINSTPKQEPSPSSQATTVDLTQALTPRQDSIEVVCETPTHFDLGNTSSTLPTPQPVRLSYGVDQEIQLPFLMASSQLLTESQLLPESLLNDFILMAPPICPSSEDYMNY
ncbi:hypothetical protein GcC1_219009 [Golovinomyces cichoracearum]|uniref:Uncharacterized protein n=1 Tax=Golovinomyces cichoracearum TaxID=62708 RepID=A0A420H854_9PEZI|nr:hypothetical protein GcC1_219009 [Golovinomyces cichoracearum]